MRPTDHRDIFVRLHPFFYQKKSASLHYIYIPGLMTSFLSDQSQRLWSAHKKPSNAFWGGGFDHPPNF